MATPKIQFNVWCFEKTVHRGQFQLSLNDLTVPNLTMRIFEELKHVNPMPWYCCAHHSMLCLNDAGDSIRLNNIDAEFSGLIKFVKTTIAHGKTSVHLIMSPEKLTEKYQTAKHIWKVLSLNSSAAGSQEVSAAAAVEDLVQNPAPVPATGKDAGAALGSTVSKVAETRKDTVTALGSAVSEVAGTEEATVTALSSTVPSESSIVKCSNAPHNCATGPIAAVTKAEVDTAACSSNVVPATEDDQASSGVRAPTTINDSKLVHFTDFSKIIGYRINREHTSKLNKLQHYADSFFHEQHSFFHEQQKNSQVQVLPGVLKVTRVPASQLVNTLQETKVLVPSSKNGDYMLVELMKQRRSCDNGRGVLHWEKQDEYGYECKKLKIPVVITNGTFSYKKLDNAKLIKEFDNILGDLDAPCANKDIQSTAQSPKSSRKERLSSSSQTAVENSNRQNDVKGSSSISVIEKTESLGPGQEQGQTDAVKNVETKSTCEVTKRDRAKITAAETEEPPAWLSVHLNKFKDQLMRDIKKTTASSASENGNDSNPSSDETSLGVSDSELVYFQKRLSGVEENLSMLRDVLFGHMKKLNDNLKEVEKFDGNSKENNKFMEMAETLDDDRVMNDMSRSNVILLKSANMDDSGKFMEIETDLHALSESGFTFELPCFCEYYFKITLVDRRSSKSNKVTLKPFFSPGQTDNLLLPYVELSTLRQNPGISDHRVCIKTGNVRGIFECYLMVVDDYKILDCPIRLLFSVKGYYTLPEQSDNFPFVDPLKQLESWLAEEKTSTKTSAGRKPSKAGSVRELIRKWGVLPKAEQYYLSSLSDPEDFDCETDTEAPARVTTDENIVTVSSVNSISQNQSGCTPLATGSNSGVVHHPQEEEVIPPTEIVENGVEISSKDNTTQNSSGSILLDTSSSSKALQSEVETGAPPRVMIDENGVAVSAKDHISQNSSVAMDQAVDEDSDSSVSLLLDEDEARLLPDNDFDVVPLPRCFVLSADQAAPDSITVGVKPKGPKSLVTSQPSAVTSVEKHEDDAGKTSTDTRQFSVESCRTGNLPEDTSVNSATQGTASFSSLEYKALHMESFFPGSRFDIGKLPGYPSTSYVKRRSTAAVSHRKRDLNGDRIRQRADENENTSVTKNAHPETAFPTKNSFDFGFKNGYDHVDLGASCINDFRKASDGVPAATRPLSESSSSVTSRLSRVPRSQRPSASTSNVRSFHLRQLRSLLLSAAPSQFSQPPTSPVPPSVTSLHPFEIPLGEAAASLYRQYSVPPPTSRFAPLHLQSIPSSTASPHQQSIPQALAASAPFSQPSVSAASSDVKSSSLEQWLNAPPNAVSESEADNVTTEPQLRISSGPHLDGRLEFLEQLLQLNEMGFEDDELSISFLKKYPNDLDRVVECLVTNHENTD